MRQTEGEAEQTLRQQLLSAVPPLGRGETTRPGGGNECALMVRLNICAANIPSPSANIFNSNSYRKKTTACSFSCWVSAAAGKFKQTGEWLVWGQASPPPGPPPPYNFPLGGLLINQPSISIMPPKLLFVALRGRNNQYVLWGQRAH